MNPTNPPTPGKPRRWLLSAIAACSAACLGTAAADTQYLNETLRDGSLPSGWSAIDVTFTTVAGGRADLKGSTGVLTSPIFDAGAETQLTLTFSVAKFGSGVDGPLTLQYSLDGGDNWISLGTSSTPTGSTYINDSIDITSTSSTMAIRFLSDASLSAKRLRDVIVTGNIPPALGISSLSPANGANNVPVNPELVITFNKPIQAGSGSLGIYDLADGTVVESIPVTSGMISGNTLTAFPSTLPFSTEHYVLLSATAVKGLDDEPFAGITSDTTWIFSTEAPDTTGPVPVAFTPSSGASNVTTDLEEISVTFDEPIVLVGTAPIEIRRVSDDTVVESISTTDFISVNIEGSNLDILVAFVFDPLDFETEYYVFFPAGTVQDNTGNPNLAFGAPTSDHPWTFTTVSVASLGDVDPYTQDFADFVSMETLPGGWFVDGSVLVYEDAWGEGFNSGFRGDANVLGYQHTSNTGELVKGVRVRNDTGAEITDLSISYRGRAERLSEGRSPAYVVRLDGVEVPELAYSTAEGDNVLNMASVSGLNIAPGAFFEITWTSDRDLTASGSSKQIGISEFSVDSGASVFPPTLGTAGLVVGSTGAFAFEAQATVVGDGGSPLAERGFVISESAVNNTPEIGGTGVTTVVDPEAELGSYSAMFSGLSASTSYTVRAYATNAEGTTYTNAFTVTTLDPPLAFNGDYQQPFNNYDGTLPFGWAAFSSTNANSFGGLWGTGTGAGFRGGVDSPGVIGYQHTGGSGLVTIEVVMQNNTGSEINELFVHYLGRVARADQGRSPIWTVKLNDVEITELSYSTESAIDETKSHMITGLAIADGEIFTISWQCERGGGSGSSKQIGIANVVINLDGTLPPPPANDYFTWIAQFPGVGSETGLFDDPDGDGIPNLLEHFLGLAPDVPNGSPMDVAAAGTGSLTVTHTRIKPDQLDPGITAIYQWSTNLSTWALSGGEIDGVTVEFGAPTVVDDSHPDYDVIEITATVTGGSATRLFVRVLADPPV